MLMSTLFSHDAYSFTFAYAYAYVVIEEVARNRKSCPKVDEHLVDSLN